MCDSSLVKLPFGCSRQLGARGAAPEAPELRDSQSRPGPGADARFWGRESGKLPGGEESPESAHFTHAEACQAP